MNNPYSNMIDSHGILFRIEDVKGPNPNQRAYDREDYDEYCIDKMNFDGLIASLVKAEINGSKNRSLHSYSKSLATCLFKYNNYIDNELHLLIDNALYYNTVTYISSHGNKKTRHYDIYERICSDSSYFNKRGQVCLTSFEIDVSNNYILEKYLKMFAHGGRKRMASPEKDNEVVVFNPIIDTSILLHIEAVYVIYGLQMRYEFLSSRRTVERFAYDIEKLDNSVFCHGWQERNALINMIYYLSSNWDYEVAISKRIYETVSKQFRVPIYYDSILQYFGILEDSFAETCNMISSYSDSVISILALKHCERFLYS